MPRPVFIGRIHVCAHAEFAFDVESLERLVVLSRIEYSGKAGPRAEVRDLFAAELFVERHADARAAQDGEVSDHPLVAVRAYDADLLSFKTVFHQISAQSVDIFFEFPVCNIFIWSASPLLDFVSSLVRVKACADGHHILERLHIIDLMMPLESRLLHIKTSPLFSVRQLRTDMI